jgi:hypothetical protein
MRLLRITSLLLSFSLFLAPSALPAASPPVVSPCGVRLSISAKALRISAGDWLEATATLENVGATKVVLVEPGDGSEAGWRTPVIRWSARRIGPGRATVATTLEPEGRCGLMNGPNPAAEVFVLAPGRSRRLRMPLVAPRLGPPGVYEVTLTYDNEPRMEFRGTSPADPAVRRYRESMACLVASNALRVEVVAGLAGSANS